MFLSRAIYEQTDDNKKAMDQFEKISDSSKLFIEALRRRIYHLRKDEKPNQKSSPAWNLIAATLAKYEKDKIDSEELFELASNYLDSASRLPEAQEFFKEGCKSIRAVSVYSICKACCLKKRASQIKP